jgi:hypothetical protein
MNEWKVRQEIYHRLKKDYEDDLSKHEIEITENIVDEAIDYFMTANKGWIYPSKSYMVAICYARWLSEEFGGNPMNYLNDTDLLYGNDPYFVQYSVDSKTYDKILSVVGWNFDEKKGMVSDVKKYFKEEFML